MFPVEDRTFVHEKFAGSGQRRKQALFRSLTGLVYGNIIKAYPQNNKSISQKFIAREKPRLKPETNTVEASRCLFAVLFEILG
jgi:hypothetical protein